MSVHFGGGSIYKTFVIIPTVEICWDMDAVSIGISFLRWTGFMSFRKKEKNNEQVL